MQLPNMMKVWLIVLILLIISDMIGGMGGNALKTVKSSRIPFEVYTKIKEDIRSKFQNAGIKVTYAYDLPDKVDFGDVDVYCSIPQGFDLHQFISTTFSTPEITSGTDPISFAYILDMSKSIYAQVDIVSCQNVEFAQLFYSYSDANMIVSRCSKAHKITYGRDGFSVLPTAKTIFGTDDYEILKQYPTTYNNKIILSTNPSKVATFYGLKERWLQNLYSTRDEIVDDLLQSRYICVTKLLHNQEKWNREPQKHVLYEIILNRLAKDIPVPIYDPLSKYEDLQMEAIAYFNKFDELEKEKAFVHNMIIEREIKLKRKEKYSGKSFVERGIRTSSIKQLKQDFEAHLRGKFAVDDYGSWLDTVDKVVIDAVLDEWLTAIKQV